MSDRGDYRSFYTAFWDDPDVHGLSDRAYRVLTTLKGTLSLVCDRCKGQKTPGNNGVASGETEAT